MLCREIIPVFLRPRQHPNVLCGPNERFFLLNFWYIKQSLSSQSFINPFETFVNVIVWALFILTVLCFCRERERHHRLEIKRCYLASLRAAIESLRVTDPSVAPTCRLQEEEEEEEEEEDPRKNDSADGYEVVATQVNFIRTRTGSVRRKDISEASNKVG